MEEMTTFVCTGELKISCLWAKTNNILKSEEIVLKRLIPVKLARIKFWDHYPDKQADISTSRAAERILSRSNK